MDPKTSTSFRQFEYCKLCRVNHKLRKKHIYSKRHQTILQNILKKFGGKIDSAKRTMFAPQVCGADFEVGAKFWCYFCEEEVGKHQQLELLTVLNAGLLEHIASEKHKAGMGTFFWENLLNKKLKPKFIFSSEDLNIFKKASLLAVKKYQKSQELERKKMASRLAETEGHRRIVNQSNHFKSQTFEVHNEQLPVAGTSWEPEVRGYSGKRTVSVMAPGLTCILRKEDPEEESGNVHSGALPPWLQPDDQSESSGAGVIGPTVEEYNKHLEREKKAKLPATRVGAKFDHSAETSQQWLPSFGRVWNKGRRLQSKQFFVKEMNMKPSLKRNHFTASASASVVPAETVSSHSDWLNEGTNYPNEPIRVADSDGASRKADLCGSMSAGQSYGYEHNGHHGHGDGSVSIATDQSVGTSSLLDPGRYIAPYKKKRKPVSTEQQLTLTSSSQSLLQTPLLADSRNAPR